MFAATRYATEIRVLALQRKGINLIFPDVLKIEKELLADG